MSKQIVIIHGGTTFNTEQEYLAYLNNKAVSKESFLSAPGWKNKLQTDLGQDYEVFTPFMPNRNNARFVEWGIWFNRLIPFLTDNIILVGHSLGGIFLAKYLSENNFPHSIKATILVAAPFEAKELDEPLASFALTKPLDNFTKQAGKIYLFYSQDDPIVPYLQATKYQQALPQAELVNFTDREHFNQESLPELQQLITTL